MSRKCSEVPALDARTDDIATDRQGLSRSRTSPSSPSNVNAMVEVARPYRVWTIVVMGPMASSRCTWPIALVPLLVRDVAMNDREQNERQPATGVRDRVGWRVRRLWS